MARDLDGVDDKLVKSSPSFIDDNTGTISIWVKSDGGAAGEQQIFSIAQGLVFPNGDEWRITYATSADFIQLVLINAGGVSWSAVTANDVLNDTNWHLWVATSDGSTTKLYKDGVEETLTDGTGSNSGQWLGDAVDADRMALGILLRNVDLIPFDGKFASFAYWDVALNDNEILALFHGVSPISIRKGNLKSHSLLFGNQDPEPDLTGNDNDLTVTGAIKSPHAPVELIGNYL